MHAFGEHDLLALLGGIRFDDANAAKRLREPPGDLGVDLAPLAEDRPQLLEGVPHHPAEGPENDERDERELPAQIEQHGEREHGGDETAGQLHESRAHQVTDAVRVGHDARDEDAGLRGVEVADRQMRYVLVDGSAHLRNRALGGDPEHLGQRERRDRLNESRRASGERNRHQQVVPPPAEDVVDEQLGRAGQHETRQPVDQHHGETKAEPAAARPDESARLLPGLGPADLLLVGLGLLCG